MAEIVMPRLSDSMEEGTILTWMKQEGDAVAVGDELVEIETDKANMAYESDVAGTLTQVLAEEGDTLAIGSPIAVVGDPGDVATPPQTSPTDTPADDSSSSAGDLPQSGHPQEGITPTPPPSAGVSVGERVKASPVARRIAAEGDVDLATLEGSGPGGRIVKADVEKARVGAAAVAEVPAASTPQQAVVGADAAGTETAKGITTYQDLTRLQQVVSRRMSESKATAPHFYLQAEIDMSAAVEARSRLKGLTAEGEVVPSFNDMIVKACALALKEFPLANGAYKDGRFELYSRVNVGVAVAAQDALVVPTVFDADKKGLREIAADARSLAGKVRDGGITPPELSGGTFSVSNLGMYGIKSFGAIVNSPQAGILAVGEIADRPVVKDGQVVPGKLMEMTLSCDHRILYGADGAEFLAEIKRILQEPLALSL